MAGVGILTCCSHEDILCVKLPSSFHLEDSGSLQFAVALYLWVFNMFHNLVVSCFLCSVAVAGFKIVSKTAPIETEIESMASDQFNFQRPVEIDSAIADHSVYEAVFAGIKKPISVDCTQPGVVCKFPLVIADDDSAPTKPAKVRAVPVIKGIDTANTEERDGNKKEEVSVKSIEENAKVPVFKGSLDIETVAADEKDIEDTWILEKSILNKKYQIPVKLIPSKQHGHGIAPVYPTHHDFHDHFGGHPYNFPNRHGQGWTPWIRSYPSVYNYPSNQPCHTPVYHQPPPCTHAVVPTKKPINIDDKVEKEED